MATINSTIDNCVLHNILSNAATSPDYKSHADKLTAFANLLPQSVVDQYYTKSKQIINSKKYTPEQFASMYQQKIIPLVETSVDETVFASQLLSLLDTL